MAETLLQWWEEVVSKYKTLPALVSSDESLTFDELDSKCDDLAKFLTDHGIRENDIVAIVTDVCLELVWAILASIKIGAVYMHLDKGYPQKIVEEIMECVKPKVILQTGSAVAVTKWRKLGKYDALTLLHGGYTDQSCQKILLSPKIAYIALTSGSTGCPKAIRGTESGLVHSIKQFLNSYPFSDGDNREACYVAFIWEFLRPLFAGCPLFIIPNHIITCGNNLAEFLARNRITRIFITSSLLEILLNEGRKLWDLKTIILCGEPVSVALLERALKILPHVCFVNLYGISEAADVASVDLGVWYKSAENKDDYENCPVGTAIPGVKIAVLDDALNPSKVGHYGEIFIAGQTIADGYIGLPGQNSKSFLHDPELLHKLDILSGPVYKSGDRGRLHKDGYLEVMGRKEKYEVLIRGQKINLKVIEQSILDIPGVQSCLLSFQDGDLIAIVVSTLPSENIYKHLLDKLPQAYVPSIIKCCTQLPINVQTGKVDVKALILNNNEQDFQTQTEKILAKIWAATLGHTCFDRTSSFFQVGGHSLLVGKLLSKINEACNIQFCADHLFEHSKFSDMAAMIEHRDLGLRFNLDEEWREICETWDGAMKKADNRLNVLLTGATGYLGGYILSKILSMTNMTVVCLVRVHAPKKDAKRYLLESLNEKHLNSGDKFERHVTVLESDLSETNFSLGKETYMSLLAEIDLVIHCAASVNMVYPYKALKKDNVEATANILQFCLSSHPKKELHYISSVSVLDDNSQLMSSETVPHSGYTQSKLLAEKLVRHVRDTAALPVTIYRPSYLSPDTSHITWNQNDAIFQFLRHCTLTKQLPCDLHLDLTPVTFAASFIVQVILRNKAKGGTYNLSNPAWTTVTDALLLRSGIRDIKMVTWEEWKDEDPEEFLGSGIQDPVRYDTTKTQRALEEWGMAYPVIKEDEFCRYLKHIV